MMMMMLMMTMMMKKMTQLHIDHCHLIQVQHKNARHRRFSRQTTQNLFVNPASPIAHTVENYFRRPMDSHSLSVSLSYFIWASSSFLPLSLDPPLSSPSSDSSFSSISSASSCSSFCLFYSPILHLPPVLPLQCKNMSTRWNLMKMRMMKMTKIITKIDGSHERAVCVCMCLCVCLSVRLYECECMFVCVCVCVCVFCCIP